MGMIYKRGDIYWIKYYSAGRPMPESIGTTQQKEATRILKEKEWRTVFIRCRMLIASRMTNWRESCGCTMRRRAHAI